MSKFYLITFLCLISASIANAQTYYWVGPSGGTWSTAANWSASSGGPGGAGVPNANTHDAIFNSNASVDVDLADIDLATLTVTSNATATLSAISDVTIVVYSVSTASPGLLISTGSTLINTAVTDADMLISFADNAQGLVDGTWRFETGESPANIGPGFLIPETTGLNNLLEVNGRLEYGPNTALMGYDITGNDYVDLNGGSVLRLEINGGTIPDFNWDENSTIQLVGNTSISTSLTESVEIGNLIYNAPGQTEDGLTLDLRNITVQGNVEILNTNSNDLIIIGNGFDFGVETIVTIIEGDLNVSGNSRVFVADANDPAKSFELQVAGALNIGGLHFDLQLDTQGDISTNTTTLKVGGDINHTAGTFSTSSSAINNTLDLFVIELNGDATQQITSVTGTFDNPGNQVTLRMNNPAGAILMSPLSVGRLSFASTDKGVLSTTNTNILTINNTAVNALTVNSPANNGYVDGPLRRRTASTDTYTFPTGEAGVLRAVDIIPSAADANTYQADYFRTAYADLSVIAPLSGVTNVEYWTLAQPVGSTTARVSLTLNGAVPGAAAADAILVAKYNGNDWANARGATGTIVTPGTATTGTVISEFQSTFGDFTLGYAAQGALPITLLSFDAKKASGNKADINWEVTSTSTPRHFELLKSANGREFNILGVVGGVIGKEKYSYSDTELGTGTTYYRLRMVDVDGTVSFSKVVAVLNGGKEVLMTSMMPTVVTSRSKINVTSSTRGTLQLLITDMHGRIIHQQQSAVVTGNQDIWLNLQALASGAYQVTGYFDGKRTSSIRFVKH